MAYIHCHNCKWEQDDFWSWHYNPLRLFIQNVFTRRYGLIYPCRIKYYSWEVKALGWKRDDPHSWWLIWWEFKKMIRRIWHMKWWTYKAWKRACAKKGRWPACPKCGKHTLDID